MDTTAAVTVPRMTRVSPNDFALGRLHDHERRFIPATVLHQYVHIGLFLCGQVGNIALDPFLRDILRDIVENHPLNEGVPRVLNDQC